MTTESAPRLLDDAALELSSVVANNAMNRGRGLSGVNSYARELGFDPYRRLAQRLRADPDATVTWIDVCCGEGRALLEAEERFAQEFPSADVTLIGIDLVGFFRARPRTDRLRLITTSATTWTPDRPADLVTCVHGLHYIGDKLAVLTAMAGWVVPGGRCAADFDPEEICRADGSAAGPAVLAALRASGMTFDRRTHRLRGEGPRSPRFPATYLGADDTAGPGYTGQPSVRSYYAW
ncbi:class I SAM-dependent methyltransferase [Nocardia sp. NPDC051833]|uniref:class I SAM-dependent methyltransferase n=1 Tax=Nocardia sp. NPDC051833 TaxID=3155674 RepID=UPI0034270B7C